MPSLFEQYYSNKGEFNNLELTLNRIKAAAENLGIGDNIAKKIIHIAGTNGKGSTALFIDQILRHRGLSTALFTSPHIMRINERIKLNGKDISDADFDSYFFKVKDAADKFSLSYFETLTLIAFMYFRDNMPDVAVIETGLGGRLDSSNILNDKIPVITSISLDHMQFLGDTVFKIADEKLAIIKDNKDVFIGQNTDELTIYIKDRLKNNNVIIPAYAEEPYMGFEIPYNNNLRLAEAVCDHIRQGSMPEGLTLPMCRMERFGKIVLDGAHNEDGLAKLMRKYEGRKPVAVFSVTNDRDLEKLYAIARPVCEKIILTEIPDNPRSINVDGITLGDLRIKSPVKAVKIAVELSKNADILVCGSLYLCGYIREILTKGNL